MKKILLILIAVLLMTGCGKKEEPIEPVEDVTENTGENVEVKEDIAEKIKTAFEEKVKETTNVSEIAEYIISTLGSEVSFATMEVEPGYLNGFSQDISEFTKGTMFSPIIGTIPFVGYVFESENTELLKDQLLESYDLRWNICTEADRAIMYEEGNIVLFAMVPGSM